MFGPHPDDFAPLATMADAHAEWHRNAGIPMGMPGCPQDACDGGMDDPEYLASLVPAAAAPAADSEGRARDFWGAAYSPTDASTWSLAYLTEGTEPPF